MRKIFLLFILACIFFNHIAFAEEDKVFDEETAAQITEAFAGLVGAWKAAYKEMSKYQKPYYTYDNSTLQGVAYVSEKFDTGNIAIVFNIKNNLNTSFDINKAGYFGVDSKSNIFRFEFVGVLCNTGIENSSIVNPKQEIEFACVMPFREYYEAKELKEVYLKIGGRRIYFVPEKFIKEYSKPENKLLRKIRDFFRDFL